MADFKSGEIVDITIKGARVRDVVVRNGGADLTFDYDAKDNATWPGSLWVDAPAVTVERVAPSEWPPRAGDLWRDRNGTLHFAATHTPDYDDRADSAGIDSDGTRVILIGHTEAASPSADWYRPEAVNQRYGPLVLVYREDKAVSA